MGHLCSCHRQARFDKGVGGSGTWNASLIHKLRLRCSYLTAAGGGTSTHPAGQLPLYDVPPLNNDDEQSPSSETNVVIDRTLPASSPSSPATTRQAPTSPRPRRMRSMLVAGDQVDQESPAWASELEPCSMSGREVRLSMSLRTLVVEGGGGLDVSSSRGSARRHATTSSTMNAILRHTCDLLESSCVHPELLVDFLRRRDVVSDETAAAIRRCGARGAACELLAEVVASKDEVSALCDGLRATGCGDEADCLAAVQSLLHLTNSFHLQRSSDSSPSALVNDRLLQEKSREHGSGCAISDVNQRGSTSRSSVDVDVVYIDLLTGNTMNDDEDDTSTTRASSLRHRRSLFTDRGTTSLSPQPLSSVAGSGGRDRLVGLPVASATFREVSFSDRLTDQLADILLRYRSFRILTFVKCQSVDACLCRIRKNLVSSVCKDVSRLSRLHVRLSHIDDVNVVAELAEVLSHSLHTLCLTGCSIMSTGCSAVVRSHVTGSRRLSELDLGYNDVADVAPLSDALAANCSLRSLRLRGNAIGPAGAASLFDSLRRNYRLELLDISGNPIGERQKSGGDDLWCTVAESLLSNRSLRDLKLERCSLDVEACSALGRALAANTTLSVLDVSLNQSIGDRGVTLLADGLRRNPRCRIRTLALNMCAVGNVGFRSLLVAIKYGGTTALQHIKLCYNRIGSRDKVRPLRQYQLRLESHLPAAFDRPGGGTPMLGRLMGSNNEGAKAVPSSMPIRRKNRSVPCPRPLSNISNSFDLLAETDDQGRQPVSTQKVTTPDCAATTKETIVNQVNYRSVLESTATTSQQLKTVADGVCNWELSTLSELSCAGDAANRRLRFDGDAGSVLGTTVCRSPGGLTMTQLDPNQLLTPTTDKNHDNNDDDDDDDEAGIYELLCHVLRANP